jgi:hypothetical protein
MTRRVAIGAWAASRRRSSVSSSVAFVSAPPPAVRVGPRASASVRWTVPVSVVKTVRRTKVSPT